MKINYKWLQTFFDEGVLPSVSELEQELTFHSFEIEGVEEKDGDSIIDIDVLPNRAADCLSHRGIAREISALFSLPMKKDVFRESDELSPVTEDTKVTIDEDSSCSYYVAVSVCDVEVKESPQWLKDRLESIGQKSINNVVDATNYVLFDIGRPTHVFDADKLDGEKPHIRTRRAKNGEKITLLGGEEKELSDTMTVIADGNSDVPLAIAGVKGGAYAEVDENTKNILIEVANFNPQQTRITAQQLKLRTDASARFENNIADRVANYGALEVTKLILDIAGGTLKGYSFNGGLDEGNTEVEVPIKKISKLLGVEVPQSDVENILDRLQFDTSTQADTIITKAPFERRDIKIPEDVIEEIGRMYGYNKIESMSLPDPEREPHINKKYAYAEKIRSVLGEKGYTEVYTYSLRDSGEVKLLNALASDKDYLRNDLSGGLVDALDNNEHNMPLLGIYDGMKIFEIGNVFTDGGEETHVAIGVRSVGKKKREERNKALLEDAKKNLEELLGTALPEVSTETLEFNLDSVIAELPDIDHYPHREVISEVQYIAPSQYPFVLRDIAVWTPEGVGGEEVLELIKENAGELLVRVDMFDTFAKDGKVSYAFHLVFQSKERTLNDTEVGEIMKSVEDIIQNQEGWEVR